MRLIGISTSFNIPSSNPQQEKSTGIDVEKLRRLRDQAAGFVDTRPHQIEERHTTSYDRESMPVEEREASPDDVSRDYFSNSSEEAEKKAKSLESRIGNLEKEMGLISVDTTSIRTFSTQQYDYWKEKRNSTLLQMNGCFHEDHDEDDDDMNIVRPETQHDERDQDMEKIANLELFQSPTTLERLKSSISGNLFIYAAARSAATCESKESHHHERLSCMPHTPIMIDECHIPEEPIEYQEFATVSQKQVRIRRTMLSRNI